MRALTRLAQASQGLIPASQSPETPLPGTITLVNPPSWLWGLAGVVLLLVLILLLKMLGVLH